MAERKKLWVSNLKSRRDKERDDKSKLKFELRLCLINRIDQHVREKRGSGFLVENLVVRKGSPPHHYLVTSEKVIPDFGDKKANYVLQFRNSDKDSEKFRNIPLREIAATTEPYNPEGDTSGIIFICLKSESEKVLKRRLFSVVVEDLQNDETLYCFFVDDSSQDFVQCLRIKQNGSGKYAVEEDDNSYTTYDSVKNNSERKPRGGAILQKVQGEFRCVGMLDFKDDEAKTLSPVFFSSIFPPKDKREEGGGDKEQPQGQLSDGGEGPPLRKSALDRREGGGGEQQSLGKRAEREKEQENCTDQGSSSGDNDKNSSLSSLSGSHQGPACSNSCSLSKRVAGDHTKRRKQHKSDSASKDINGHGKTPHKSSESLKSERLPLKEGERGEEGSEEQSSEDKQRNCSDQGLSSGDNDKNSSLSSLSGSYQGPASRISRSLSKRVAGDHTKRRKQHKSDLASKDINGRGKTPLKSRKSLKKKRKRESLREDGRTCASSSYRENARQQETLNQGVDQDTCTQDISWTTKVYNWLYSLLTWIVLTWIYISILGKNSNERVGDSYITEEPLSTQNEQWKITLMAVDKVLKLKQRGESSSKQRQSVEGGKEQPPGKTGEGGQPAEGGVEQPPGETAEGGPGDVLDGAASRGTAGSILEERGEVNGDRQPQEQSPQGEEKQPPGETGEGGKQQPPRDLLGATSWGTTGRTQSDSSSSSGGADSSLVEEPESRRRKRIQKRIQKRNARHSKAPSSAAL